MADTNIKLSGDILSEEDIGATVAVCREYVAIPKVAFATTETPGIVKLAPLPKENE